MAEFWETSSVAGEMDLWRDVQGAAHCLRPLFSPGKPLVLIGYSFGCASIPNTAAPTGYSDRSGLAGKFATGCGRLTIWSCSALRRWPICGPAG
jgi:hypothetical protein